MLAVPQYITLLISSGVPLKLTIFHAPFFLLNKNQAILYHTKYSMSNRKSRVRVPDFLHLPQRDFLVVIYPSRANASYCIDFDTEQLPYPCFLVQDCHFCCSSFDLTAVNRLHHHSTMVALPAPLPVDHALLLLYNVSWRPPLCLFLRTHPKLYRLEYSDATASTLKIQGQNSHSQTWSTYVDYLLKAFRK